MFHLLNEGQNDLQRKELRASQFRQLAAQAPGTVKKGKEDAKPLEEGDCSDYMLLQIGRLHRSYSAGKTGERGRRCLTLWVSVQSGFSQRPSTNLVQIATLSRSCTYGHVAPSRLHLPARNTDARIG